MLMTPVEFGGYENDFCQVVNSTFCEGTFTAVSTPSEGVYLVLIILMVFLFII